MEVISRYLALAEVPPKKKLPYPFKVRLNGLQSRSGRLAENKTVSLSLSLSLMQLIESRTVDSVA